MDNFVDLLFLTNVAWLLAHELDAIYHHEWRIFFFLRPFEDITAYRIFTALHIPLLVGILWGLPSRDFQIGFDLFLIFHAGLHWVFRRHPHYSFDGFSNVWIFGAVPLALLHLALL